VGRDNGPIFLMLGGKEGLKAWAQVMPMCLLSADQEPPPSAIPSMSWSSTPRTQLRSAGFAPGRCLGPFNDDN
jgi:hypothetical protein